MSNLTERVSYLKGLASGMEIDEKTKEGKLLLAVIDTMQAMAEAMQELAQSQQELDEYVEDIDEDLSDLEELLFHDMEDDGYDEDDEDDLIEYDCPHCDTTNLFNREDFTMEENHLCSGCGKPVFEDEGSEPPEDDE